MIAPADIKSLFAKTKGPDHKYRAACPLHGERDLNLSVYTRKDNTIGFTCFSHQCDRRNILEALGYSLADALPDRTPQEKANHKRVVKNKQFASDLQHSFLILNLWVDDLYSGLYPRNKGDVDIVRKALKKVKSATEYLLQGSGL